MKDQRLWLFLELASQNHQMILGCLTVIDSWADMTKGHSIRWSWEDGKTTFLFPDPWITTEKASSNGGTTNWIQDLKYSFALDVACIQILTSCEYK